MAALPTLQNCIVSAGEDVASSRETDHADHDGVCVSETFSMRSSGAAWSERGASCMVCVVHPFVARRMLVSVVPVI